MNSILKKIVLHKKQEMAQLKAVTPLSNVASDYRLQRNSPCPIAGDTPGSDRARHEAGVTRQRRQRMYEIEKLAETHDKIFKVSYEARNNPAYITAKKITCGCFRFVTIRA